jgi:hypothetical protein
MESPAGERRSSIFASDFQSAAAACESKRSAQTLRTATKAIFFPQTPLVKCESISPISTSTHIHPRGKRRQDYDLNLLPSEKDPNYYGDSRRLAAGEFSPNFDLQNTISTNTKDFSWIKMAQIRQISQKNNFKSPDFDDKFQ